MKKVFIAHPGQQHSHQFAQALYEAGYLEKYIAGIPIRADRSEYSYLPKLVRSKIKTVPIPPSYRSHPYFWQLLLKLGGRFCRPSGVDFPHKVFHWFDDWCAKAIRSYSPDIVVCFENSAAATFKAAKEMGARCVLDAPSIHFQTADQLSPPLTKGYLSAINQRKSQEIAQADLMITCSEFAADTYRAAGVSSQKLLPILLGAELPAVIESPIGDSRNHRTDSVNKAVEFIFAGKLCYRKSIDIVLETFAKLYQAGIHAKLVLVGGCDDPDIIERMQGMPNIEYLGQLSQVALYQRFALADCQILLSRFDAFGMVVVEGMATGLPAIVSTNTGAKEIIKDYPAAGWVVEPTVSSLQAVIMPLVNDRKRLSLASEAALTAASEYTWAAYRKRIASCIGSLF